MRHSSWSRLRCLINTDCKEVSEIIKARQHQSAATWPHDSHMWGSHCIIKHSDSCQTAHLVHVRTSYTSEIMAVDHFWELAWISLSTSYPSNSLLFSLWNLPPSPSHLFYSFFPNHKNVTVLLGQPAPTLKGCVKPRAKFMKCFQRGWSSCITTENNYNAVDQDVEFEWSVFYGESTRQLNLS